MTFQEWLAEIVESEETRELEAAKADLTRAAEAHTKAEDRLEDAQARYQRALQSCRDAWNEEVAA